MDTADDFYSIMGVLAREILEFGLMEPNRLVQVTCLLLLTNWILLLRLNHLCTGCGEHRAVPHARTQRTSRQVQVPEDSINPPT